jgi:putative membrane protein
VDDQLADATRRTRLANERTFLAWLRGGLTSIAVGVGAGAVIPGVAPVTRWPFLALGVGFGLFGVLLMGVGAVRRREVERALAEGRYVPLRAGAALALAACGMGLGLLSVVAVVIEM